MNGGKNRQPLGYTIVEVLIVLAVSAMMFLVAATFINGKQERTSFAAGINQFASQIQDSIEQVSSGSYSDIPLQCSSSGGVVSLGASPSAGGQGTNTGCIFMGKLLTFSLSGATGSTSYYTVSTLAGAQVANDPTLGTVDPTVISSPIDLDQSLGVPDNLIVTQMRIHDASGASHTNYANFGFVPSLGQGFSAAGGAFQSGNQAVSLVYSPYAAATGTPLSTIETGYKNNLQYAQSVLVCVYDGTQTGELILGAGSSQLQVNAHNLGPGKGGVCP